MSTHPAGTTIVDFNAHLHPTDPPEYRGTVERIERHTDLAVPRDMDALAAHYREAGVDGAVVSSSFFMGHGDGSRVAAANDALLDEVDGHDGFHALAAIPTASGPEAAAAEFERCLDAGFNGGGLKTTSDGIAVHDDRLDPVLEVADRTGAPILVKPKIHDSLHPDAFDSRWQLNGVFGRETALAASIYGVIAAGVLDRFPDLDLVYHHAGGNIAGMLDRIRLKLGEGSWTRTDHEPSFDTFVDRLSTRIHLDTSGYHGSPTVLRRTLEVVPAANLVFGTDYPHETPDLGSFDRVADGIRQVAPGPDARGILGGNALDLLVNT